MEPAARFEDLKIPVPSAEGGLEVSGVLGIPEWWPSGARVGVILAPGASGRHDEPLVEDLHRELTERKFLTLRFNFPFGEAKKKRADPMLTLRQTYRAAVQILSADPTSAPAHVFIGGVGLGAKVASVVATDRIRVTGLFSLGYPLHPARKPDKAEAEQLYRIITPMLFVQGEKSQNCDLDVLRRCLARVGAPTGLHVIDEADHLFKVPKKSGRSQEEVLSESLTVLENWFGKVVNS
ncbi:MAG: dienelactone hydrolase family protein [Deltaproteobacteria bacterium]|nr:dienelactone hydrolase family protein [Deltaproteobacteria bacterium]MBW2446230.1 dienelactone hydrolase family protein [Deltaproteobacteria bacterium]